MESEGPSPEMVVRDGVFDKGMAGSANVGFNRRRRVFAFPGAEGRKRERLCPNADRRRRGLNEIFKVDFRDWRELGIVFSASNKGRSARFYPAEEGRRRLGLPEVDSKSVEVEERLLEGVNVVLVVDV